MSGQLRSASCSGPRQSGWDARWGRWSACGWGHGAGGEMLDHLSGRSPRHRRRGGTTPPPPGWRGGLLVARRATGSVPAVRDGVYLRELPRAAALHWHARQGPRCGSTPGHRGRLRRGVGDLPLSDWNTLERRFVPGRHAPTHLNASTRAFPTRADDPAIRAGGAWLGASTPSNDLETLIRAFRVVSDKRPDAPAVFGLPRRERGYRSQSTVIRPSTWERRSRSPVGWPRLDATPRPGLRLSTSPKGFP